MTAGPETPAFLDLVAEVLGVGPRSLSDDSGSGTLGAWTSRKQLELVVTLEESYGVSFSHSEIKSMRSLGAVRRVLAAKGVAV